MPEPRALADVEPILRSARTIALLGANPLQDRPAYYVPAYLHARGYAIYPVHTAHVGKELFGRSVTATLAEIGVPIDIVDVFRRSEAIEAHLPDILAMVPLPKVVWFQQGIVNQVAAAILTAHGITVVQDRCTLADHRALGL